MVPPVALAGLPAAITILVLVPNPVVQLTAAAVGGACGAMVWIAIQGTTLGLRPGQPGTTSAVVGTISLPAYAFPVLVGIVADRAGLTAAMSLYVAVTVALLALLVPLAGLRARLSRSG